ncbi:MAG TPA: c-type cytochrome [Pseudogracilibacillus sp.]|nr:c-type cytochrome [Pseudogracilibacillus sp.]
MLKSKRFYFVFIVLMLVAVACSSNDNETAVEENEENGESEELAYEPPSMEDLDPDDPMTPIIEYGEELFNETNTVLPENVGNELSCMSCHADGGISQSSSMVGVTTQYPMYIPRSGHAVTIQDRINGCMVRSMNGEMLDQDSEEMRAMESYLAYISEGIEMGEAIPWRMLNTMDEVPEPSIESGEELYESKNCLSCHATDGAGTGANSGPALWGDNSFNDGAGMGRLTKMAGYIQNNMPIGQEYELTDQEAADLAAFILAQDRPIWEGHDTDWPNGGRPTDIIDQERRDQIQDGTFDWTEIENIIPAD